MAFEMLFGAGSTPEDRRERMEERKSILDWMVGELAKLRSVVGSADRHRLDQFTTYAREIERRIERTEARNKSGEQRELPGAPSGVPDSFDEHVKLMFDLQALAFMTDTTRVFALKLGRDASSRVYPESGVRGGFHPLSHHNDRIDPLLEFARINRYHVSLLPYLMNALREIKTPTGHLLDETAIIYGSPMGNANLHNHKRCPLLFLGKGNGALTGNRHLFFPAGTPMANPMLSLMQGLGLPLTQFGDSTGTPSLS
jgi:predicted component of type VI protein secretion system